MPKRVPIIAAEYIARQYNLSQVIIVAWDGELTHIVTYGNTKKMCEQAAQGGNVIAKALGLR